MPPEVPGKNNVCAVFVTYHPDEGFPRRVDAVSEQVAATVIVDNGSDARAVEMLRRVASRTGTELITNDRNLGIATALNRGLRRAGEHKCLWALTLDQDTTPGAEVVEHLCAAYRDCPFRDSVALVAANFFDPVAGRSFYPVYPGPRRWVEVTTAITSGSLLRLPALQRTGPFREELFIDSVDNEFCLRLRRRGYRVIVSKACDMTHVLGGERSVYDRHSVRISASDYGPLRRYYITRNRLLVAAEYYETEGAWVVREMIRALLEAAAMLLLERDKLAKIKATLLGAWHAAVGRLGPAPERLGRPRP